MSDNDEQHVEQKQENIERRRNSRRAVSSKTEQRKSALEELRNARASGKIYRRNTDNLVKDVYELVPEEEYEKIQRQRAAENFVEDDDGTGYFDDGTVDDFEDEHDDYDKPSSSKLKNKKPSTEKKRKKGGMYDFLQTNVASKDKMLENTPCNVNEDPDVLALLNQLGEDFAEDAAKPMSFNSNVTDFASFTSHSDADKQPGLTFSWPSESPFDDTPSVETTSVNVEKFRPIKRPSTAVIDESTAPKILKLDVPDVKIEPDDAVSMQLEDLDSSKSNTKEALIEVKPELSPTKHDQLNDLSENKFVQFDNFNESNMCEDLDENDTTVDDSVDVNALRMYWIETFEDVYKNPGSVYLFGKVGRKSCCVIVKNVEHKIYFLPRKVDEEHNCNLAEVHAEVQEKFLNNCFFFTSDNKDRMFRAKPEDIKWIPTDERLPRELQALMVMYKGHLPKIPQNNTGKTYSHVLNTTATAMERFLLETKLRGPCWIDINNASESKRKLSHCDLEYVVDMKTGAEYNIKAANIKNPSPFINLLSLNIVSVPSSNGKDVEIIMISCVYRNKALLDRANNPSLKAYETFCVVTSPKSGVMPLTFDAELKALNIGPDAVRKMPNERALLNSFFAKLRQFDPDILIMHDASAQISLLIARAEKYSIKTWSFVSRLNRTQAPGRLCKTKAGQWELMAGRSVLCSKTAAEELYMTRSYELGDLVALLLPNMSRHQLSVADILMPFMNPNSKLRVGQLIQWSWLEAFFAFQIVLQLSALPLFVQITQIVGGILSRTLLGGRSERNEYLLLHAFYESGYVPPDKHQFNSNKKDNKALKNESGIHDEDTEMKAGASRKAQYTGGLVLEPKKGFYDTYIVLLDFNSLYPSIIQEYNICFTTVDRCYEEPDEKGLPAPPQDTVSEGILSIEIGNLVRSRREVKTQMQKVRPGTDEYLRLDVRQKGLKLTANSMYGCLGFGMSRFCAKTLAAMITSKGRELLSRTKEIVEKRGYVVVYGDTDSIMINTNTPIYADACRLAFDLRKIVNGGFKHVEMDVDGLFKRLLLLKKKKYAALTVSLESENYVKKEMKGLDIVRRDWSKLAKDVGERIVDLILSLKEREELVGDVVLVLNELAEKLKSNMFPNEDFEILKQLTKSPHEYVDVKNQPHALVAQRLNASKAYNLRQGDVVKYIICQDGTSNSAIQRAYHSTELASNDQLSIDTYYYLSQQVHPVVMRLCEPFAELDASRIAEALGLDSSGFRSHGATHQSVDYSSFDVTDAFVDFDTCEGFQFECPECKKPIVVRSTLLGEAKKLHFALEVCPECCCNLLRYDEDLKSTLIIQLNNFIRKYSTALFVCDDQTCGYQESDYLELIWTSCQGPLCPQCKSTFMRKQYSLRDLFFQQKFFKQIFDYRKFLDNHCSDEQKRTLKCQGTFSHMARMYDDFESLVLKYMESNRYNRVDMSRILSGFKRLF